MNRSPQWRISILMTRYKNNFLAVERADDLIHGLALFGERFFTDHVNVSFGARADVMGMRERRRTDIDKIELLLVEHLFEIGIKLRGREQCFDCALLRVD